MSELSDLYQDVILDHSRHPHNYHAMPDATQKAEGFNPLCGDRVTLYLKLKGDVVEDISFEGNGCAISKSSTSIMTDVLKGKTRAEVKALFDRFHHLVTEGGAIEENDKLAVFSGVSAFPMRVKCAVLAWHTLRSALEGKPDRVSTE
ncbi:MAG: SUF system NifU family Fe-S cluster assembly protein [Elusimicrobiota bacterium]|jgi:nitrogen fixation NifU-like protein